MIEYKREYENQEAEIRDSWHGTAIGFVCVVLLGLAFREFALADNYFGSSQLVRRSFHLGIALAFAIYLFKIKDAEGFETLEKIRFALFSILFCVIFSFWIVPFTNRALPMVLESRSIEAEIINVTPGNRIRIGKKEEGVNDFTDLALRILVSKVAMNPITSETVYPEVRFYNYDSQRHPIGSTITVQLYQGRWGQDFILPLND